MFLFQSGPDLNIKGSQLVGFNWLLKQYLHNLDIYDVPEVKEYVYKLIEQATYLHNMFPAGVGAGFLFVLASFATFYFWIRSKVSSNNRSAYVLRDLGQN